MSQGKTLLARQISLPLSQPINHHEKLHHAAHGAVLYWEALKTEKRWTKIQPGDPVEKLIAGFAGGSDTYLTVNEFYGWRNIRQLKSLRCCYVDIDGTADLDQALDLLREEQMPAPSFVVFSGRGLHCYWLLEPTPAQALPVWQQVQDTLIRALLPIGADQRARDSTRVLRLVGTKNGKNNNDVRGLILTDQVWTMHELADEVLGHRPDPKTKEPRQKAQAPTTAQLFSFAGEGARKKRTAGKVRTGSIYAWWHLVYRDLITITDHYWFGGVPTGYRDSMLFLMSVSLSWFTHADMLEDEIARTAISFMPSLTLEEVTTQMKPVVNRAMDAAAGKKLTYKGMEVDPRYRFRAETLRSQLDGLIPEELYPQLRALVPAEIIEQRKKERDAARWNDKNTGDGYRLGNADKRATARLMAAGGASLRKIAAEVGVSLRTVQNWIG